jgi:hypothetical protein
LAISYENGTREVINAFTAPATAAQAPATTTAPIAQATAAPLRPTGAPHEKNYYTGIYFNPLGFALAGPMLGAEFTFRRHFILDTHLRFSSLGLLSPLLTGDSNVTDLSGIGVGISGKYFTGGRRGGFYVGPVVEAFTESYDHGYDSHWEGSGVLFAANLGYKFQFGSGLYMRTGGYIGVSSYSGSGTYGSEEGSGAFFSAEFALGWAF